MYAIRKTKTTKYNELLKKFQIKLNEASAKNDKLEQSAIKLLMKKIEKINS